MGWKSDRKSDKEKRDSQLGTPSEASYDEKNDAKGKPDSKAVVAKPEPAKPTVLPVSFRSLFR